MLAAAARYRVLELILDEIRPGCPLSEIPDQPPTGSVYTLAVRDRGRRKVLLINKTNAPVVVSLEGLRGAAVRIVDQQSAGGRIREEQVSGETYAIGGYAVAIATLAG